jgi:hypothetical protein
MVSRSDRSDPQQISSGLFPDVLDGCKGVRLAPRDRRPLRRGVAATSVRKREIEYDTSGHPKNALYLDLPLKLNSRSIRLLDHTRLINQLAGLERRTSRGVGYDRPSGPELILTGRKTNTAHQVPDWGILSLLSGDVHSCYEEIFCPLSTGVNLANQNSMSSLLRRPAL